jgi:DNA-binding response OmpR family regulator
MDCAAWGAAVTVNMKAKILLIEGKRADRPSFVAGLARKGYQVESAVNGSEALARLKDIAPDLIIVNAASMRSSGRRICQSIRARAHGVKIVLIMDANNGDGDEKFNNNLPADVILTLPFTLQKLMNRIRPLLPAEQKDLLKAGPLQLDLIQRWVRVGTRQSSLTPRLVHLLKLLMEHPGAVIERATLFRTVWDTAYTEDTRTLDVHISWLRHAIEDDPRSPVFIKTVRGVGYRLDIEN